MVDHSANSESPREEFISEPLTPVRGTANRQEAAIGVPGLPRQFTWRSTTYTVAEVLLTWKASSPEGGTAGNEIYLRRHYWKLRTTDGTVMTVYCLRQARRKQNRWWVYTVERE